jgi:CBS domain-containing protein
MMTPHTGVSARAGDTLGEENYEQEISRNKEKPTMMFVTVASLLKEKEKSKVVSVAPTATVVEAVRAMNDAKIGSVIVLDQQKLVGIFTERDVLVRVIGGSRDPLTTPVSEVMTSAVRSVEPSMSLDEAVRLMSGQRYRHLPVQENGQVRGIISMGDITSWTLRSQKEQVTLAIGAVRRMGFSNRRG